MTIGVPRSEGLLETIELQRMGCALNGSTVYDEVLMAVAADVRAGGACVQVLGPWADAPFADAIVLRFLGAVHHLVLEGRLPALAGQFPSAGGQPDRRLRATFLAAVREQADVLVPLMAEGVQTNEVGRSASLLGGFLELARLGLPLRVLEPGASAGLNLRFDHYRYDAGGASFGPADSPLRFVDPWPGSAPPLDAPLEVCERVGCDLEPIDPATPAGRLRLRSYVWPDQVERLARLDAALEVAAAVPARVERADAAAWLAERTAVPVPGVLTVVAHSIMFQYLTPAARQAMLAAIDAAGRRATPDAPFAWLRMEPGGERAEIRLTTWPGAASRLLATSSFHGPPIHWRPTATATPASNVE
ncbi:MAG: hypothetical protein JWN46_3722 [Acidimicrobiales bacterium]|nr:hypothetical protein [Acidimicrobiales bacterium]